MRMYKATDRFTGTNPRPILEYGLDPKVCANAGELFLNMIFSSC